jgi:competence protein ComFC
MSFSFVCADCQAYLFTPAISKRYLEDGLTVYSFYPYSQVEDFIKAKHKYHGQKIYKLLAKNSFKIFADNFAYDKKVFALPIDDKLSTLYSHTAILAKSLKSEYITPKFGVLRAKNSVTYSTKSLEFRLKNPRYFNYTFKENIEAILVDDVITTGTTLLEAKETLKKYNVNVLFALTLADARQ